MKIAFIIPPPLDLKPPAERIFGCNYGLYKMPNIFILYPATILKNNGNVVEIIDFVADNKTISDFNCFCEKHDFDIIIFSTVFLSAETDIKARNMLKNKNKNKNVKFIFISSVPTAEPERFVDEVSVVIRGESEPVIACVVQKLVDNLSLRSVSGVSFVEKEHIIHNGPAIVVENLDELPIPDRSMLSISKYKSPKFTKQPFTTVLSSRGCSYRCKFCVPNSLSFCREIEFKKFNRIKPQVKRRSNANIYMELKQLHDEGYRSFTFIDDQFIWNDKDTLDLCEQMQEFDFEWSCLVRADRLQNTNVIHAMARAGCISIDIGVESFNQQILDDIHKDCTVEQLHIAINNVKNAGISPKLNMLIAATPLETEETIEQTFQEALKLDLDILMISICTPFPHTEFNKLARENGWMIQDKYVGVNPIKEAFISYPHLSKRKLERIIKKLYKRFYLRPSYILKRLKGLNGLIDFIDKVKIAISIFSGK